MPDYSERLRLDPARVRRHVVACAGWGRVLQREAEELRGAADRAARGEPDADAAAIRAEAEQRTHAAASSFTVAASFAALYDPALAELLFWIASVEYSLAGNRLFGAVLAACTNDRAAHQYWARIVGGSAYPPRDRVYALLAFARVWRDDGGGPGRDAIRPLLDDVATWRGGHLTELFVPASVFVDVVASALELPSRPEAPPPDPVGAMARLLEAYDDQLALARVSRTRWPAFSTRFLPVSPEVLATILVADTRAWNASSRESQILLDVAGEIRALREGRRDLGDVPNVVRDLARSRWGER
jgi:hypothetical protein